MTEEPKMNLSGEFINDGFAIANYINLMGDDLRYLANAFNTCGNDMMYEKLHYMSQECRMLEKAIRDLVGNESGRGLRDAQQASANILLACLGGAKMSSEEKTSDVVIVP